MSDRYKEGTVQCEKCHRYNITHVVDLSDNSYEFIDGEQCENCQKVFCNECYEKHMKEDK